MSAASEITRQAKSNLAFALRILPRERRDDMVVFYAFCRRMDDLADDPAEPLEKRIHALNAWEHGMKHGFAAPDEFQREVLTLRDRQGLPNELLLAIIDGCRMDTRPQRFATWEDLSAYIWKVSCAVGLVSIRLFGCQDPGSEKYAVALGHALQLTNILRDVGEDLDNGGRIYLPLEDLARFGYPEQDLARRVADGRFLDLMKFEADRAGEYFRQAAACLPIRDRHPLTTARAMADIYGKLLEEMRADGFRVLEKRYRLSRARKLAILCKHLIARSFSIE